MSNYDANMNNILRQMEEAAKASNASAPAATKPTVVPWASFVQFMKQDDYWSRWDYGSNIAEEDAYFINAMNDITNQVQRAHYDFDLGNPQVFSKSEYTNWEHDGESLLYFYQKWKSGVRI